MHRNGYCNAADAEYANAVAGAQPFYIEMGIAIMEMIKYDYKQETTHRIRKGETYGTGRDYAAAKDDNRIR